MNETVIKIGALPTVELVASTMTFDEVVNQFCLQQDELRARLARVGMEGSPEPSMF